MDTYKDEEFDKRKALAPLVALLIAVMCIAGVGVAYAYTALTSTQNIEDNTVDDQYILLKSNVDGTMAVDVLDEIAFDSVRVDETTFNYTVHPDKDGTADKTITIGSDSNAHAYEVMKISKDNWTVAVEKHITGDTATTYADTYSLTVSVSKFNATAGLTYIMMVNNTPVVCTADATAHTGTWTFSGLNYKTDSAGTYDVELYVAGTTTTSATAPVSGFTNYVASSEDGSVFTFTATADERVTP